MTDVGAARVEVTGDVSSFASEVQSELDSILTGISVEPVEVTGDFSEAETSAEDASNTIADDFEQGAEGATDALGDVEGDFTEPEQAAQETAESIATDFEESADRSSEAMETAAGVMVGAIAGVTAAVAAAGVGVAALAFDVAGLGDDLDKTSARIGVATDFLQDLRFWASQNGIAAGSLDRTMERLSRSIGEAASETGPARDAFEALGVSVTGANGELRDNESVFRDSIAALMDIQDPAAQTAAAYDIFGRAAVDLLPALRDNALTLEDATAIMDDAGRATQEQIDLAVRFSDSWDQAKIRMRAFLFDAAEPVMVFFADDLFPFLNNVLLPVIGDVIDAFQEDGLAGAFNALKESFSGEGLLPSLSELFNSVLTFIETNIDNIIDFILDTREAFFDAVINVIGSVAEALPEIIPRVVEAVVSMVTTIVETLVTAAPLVLEGAILLITGLIDGILSSLPMVLDAAVSIVTTLITVIVESLPDLLDAGIQLLVGVVTGIISALPQLQAAVLELIPTIILAVIQLLPQLSTLGIELLMALVSGIVDSIPEMIQTIQNDVIPAFLDAVENEFPAAIEQGVQFLEQFVTGLADSIDQIATVVSEEVVPAFTELLRDNPEIVDAAIDVLMTLINAWVDNIDLITEFITETLIPLMTQVIEEDLPAIIDAGVLILEALIDGMIEATPEINQAIITQIIPAMISALLTAIPAMNQAAFQLIGALVSSLWRAWRERAGENLRRIRNAITGFFGRARDWLANAGRSIISGLWDGMRERWNEVTSWLSGLGSVIRNLKGPESVDRALLRDPGKWIMQGLQEGLESERGNLETQLRDITESIQIGGMAASQGRATGGDGASAMDRPGTRNPAGVRVWPAQSDQRTVLEIQATDDTEYSKFLISELRKAVRVKGGNVQLVIGTGGTRSGTGRGSQ